MLRFTANLSLLFTELPLPERFQAAKQCGFDAVEIQFPYSLPVEQIGDLLAQQDLKLVLFNVDADTLLQGGEGLAAVPEKREQFKVAVGQTLAYAERLKPRVINVLPGRCFDPQRLGEYQTTFCENLAYAAAAFAELGIKTVFEAVNSYDMPGFIVDTGDKMLDVLEQIGHPNVYMQYDIYHMSRMGEDCAGFLRQHTDRIEHIQFADSPGRGQPGTGAVDFKTLFDIIANSDYKGWVGSEYRPTADTAASLAWLKTYAVK
ncbi:hydroxypyruvate isomerase family protein [Methylomonas sp. ZR1]|uniref:hydroxypyruvate isomerase family protein n=1 Tax=Methylomonas sp. ZR1 TaxID=1797072 RepID=UPI0014917A8D|nr:TIM barrel protein [Methylomonas sp. ZR1]NOV30083.1 hydroxypyruvate isomerase [Methylomonas sp. ZR1]